MAKTWDVYTGRPSWHQERAGHISAAVASGFASREEAEAYAAQCRELRPHETTFVVLHTFVVPQEREKSVSMEGE